MSSSAQTRKSISFILIVWSTLYVYLCLHRQKKKLYYYAYFACGAHGKLGYGTFIYYVSKNLVLFLTHQHVSIDTRERQQKGHFLDPATQSFDEVIYERSPTLY